MDMSQKEKLRAEIEKANGNPKYLGLNKGNIDLTERPVLFNGDGSISTVDSASYNIDGKEVLLPTIGRNSKGMPKRMTDDEAVEHYRSTGQHLGKFDTPEEADRYADKLHRQQDAYYNGKRIKRESGFQRLRQDMLGRK